MYVIPVYSPGITLIHRHGEKHHFSTLESAWRELGYWWIKSNVGLDFSKEIYDPIAWSFRYPDWVMRDDSGCAVTAQDFEVYNRKYNPRPWWMPSHDYCGHGPVPGTGRRRNGRMFRGMKHINERRQAALVLEEEGEVRPRARRSVNSLPNPYDDYPISAREDRNWKRYRKTQWKSSQ